MNTPLPTSTNLLILSPQLDQTKKKSPQLASPFRSTFSQDYFLPTFEATTMLIIASHFQTDVWQRTKPFVHQSRLPPDVLPIRFKFHNTYTRAWCPQEDEINHDVPIVMSYPPRNLLQLETEETITIPRTALSDTTRALVVSVLSSMLVPEDAQQSIIQKVSHLLVECSSNTSTMEMPIVVGINYVTCLLRSGTSTSNIGNQMSDEAINRVANESMQTYEAKTIPADKSFIESLEKVRFHDLEATKQASCTICMEEFENGVQVSRLPCLHVYHGDCIVQWLQMCHLCPLCRCPMPHAQ